MALGRKLKYGMVGGGPGAFIGAVHRKAAALDGLTELVAGAFSTSPDRSRQQGEALMLNPSRVYGSYQEMAEKEAKLPDGERIDFVSIVTPNHVHFKIAKTFIEAGFHIVCDKPMTTTLDDAEALCRLVAEHDIVFALTHNYTGYPMVKHARHMVRSGMLGELRKIMVEYPQGWLTTPLEQEGSKQAVWRTDPKLAGAGALGDIGSHAENLACYIADRHLVALCADVNTFVPGRRLDDDINVLTEYEGGVKGVLAASQIAAGEENNLSIRVYGTKGSLRWRQEHPNDLFYRALGEPEQVLRRGNDYLSDVAKHNTRLPSGHPEAFLEAFANIYVNASRTIAARLAGEAPSALDLDFPTHIEGAYGVHFIETVLRSGEARAWVDARYTPVV